MFSNDSNAVLKNVQFELYGEMLVRLYSLPRDQYLSACQLVQAETDLAVRLRSMESFDHRTLQGTHDVIAAWFRLCHDDRGQLRLGETLVTYPERLALDWREFFEAEIRSLTSDHVFTRGILVVTAYDNTERRYAAEAQLRTILIVRYQKMKQVYRKPALWGRALCKGRITLVMQPLGAKRFAYFLGASLKALYAAFTITGWTSLGLGLLRMFAASAYQHRSPEAGRWLFMILEGVLLIFGITMTFYAYRRHPG